MIAWKVPESDEHPGGLKYSFQYMDPDGNTLLRFDNAPYHLDIGRHHRHDAAGDIEALEYEGLPALIDQFQNEVEEIYEQRT